MNIDSKLVAGAWFHALAKAGRRLLGITFYFSTLLFAVIFLYIPVVSQLHSSLSSGQARGLPIILAFPTTGHAAIHAEPSVRNVVGLLKEADFYTLEQLEQGNVLVWRPPGYANPPDRTSAQERPNEVGYMKREELIFQPSQEEWNKRFGEIQTEDLSQFFILRAGKQSLPYLLPKFDNGILSHLTVFKYKDHACIYKGSYSINQGRIEVEGGQVLFAGMAVVFFDLPAFFCCFYLFKHYRNRRIFPLTLTTLLAMLFFLAGQGMYNM